MNPFNLRDNLTPPISATSPKSLRQLTGRGEPPKRNSFFFVSHIQILIFFYFYCCTSATPPSSLKPQTR
jgi:hypothetical protein